MVQGGACLKLVTCLYRRVRSVFREITALRIPLHAANAGFFLVLSLFPGLVLVLSLLRYTALEVDTLLDVLSPLIPDALESMAGNLILTTYRSSNRTVVGLSALTGLWSASRGVHGLLTGLKAVYGITERRGWFSARLLSMVYTLAFILVLMLTLILHVFGSTLLQWMPRSKSPFLRFLTEAMSFRFFLLLLVQTLFFCLIYTAVTRQQESFWDNAPGALFSSLGWLAFSDLFSLYVIYFPRYGNIFGSVYAVALSMLWLYCCLSILFYGGALNRWLQTRKNRPRIQ